MHNTNSADTYDKGEFSSLFYPQSIALVGVSREMKAGRILLKAILEAGYNGPIYPINPKMKEVEGIKVYPDVASVDGPIDMAIILVSNSMVENVLRRCSLKKTRVAVIYSAGYSDLGTSEGRDREQKLVSLSRRLGIRLLGPNCMGVYNPSHGISFLPSLSRTSGKIGFISQSGSLANLLCLVANVCHMYFSQAVSIGNECDLRTHDFMNYFCQDDNTDIVGLYIEGPTDGYQFMTALRQLCQKKPAVIWKAGLSREGGKAVLSHTGGLAGDKRIWTSMLKQTGAISVTGFEDMLDTLAAFYYPPKLSGRKVAVITGQGGLAVASADACARHGLELASLDPDTTTRLTSILSASGTSLRNPIDIGLEGAMDIDQYGSVVKAVASDPQVDLIFTIGSPLSAEFNRDYVHTLVAIRNEYGLPVINISCPGSPPEFAKESCAAGIHAFPSPERAMKAYSNVLKYLQFKETQAISEIDRE